MKRYFIIAYDVSDDRKRARVGELLEKVGTRVNRSVFECRMREKELVDLRKQVQRIGKGPGDSVLYYPLCRRCMEKVLRDGVTLPERLVVEVV